MNTTKAVLAHLLEQLVDRMPTYDMHDAEYDRDRADYDDEPVEVDA